MHMPLQWPLGPSGAIRCARRAAGLAETPKRTYFGSQNGSQIGRFWGLVDLDVAYFDIQGLKSRPQIGPFWTPPGDLVPEGPNMTMGGSGRRYPECICPCNGPLGHPRDIPGIPWCQRPQIPHLDPSKWVQNRSFLGSETPDLTSDIDLSSIGHRFVMPNP